MHSIVGATDEHNINPGTQQGAGGPSKIYKDPARGENDEADMVV